MELDSNYDRIAAGIALESILDAAVKEMRTVPDQAVQHLCDVDVERLMLQQTGAEKKQWRLVTVSNDGKPDCEVVFRMQGILSRVDVVAGTNMAKCNISKAAHLSQRIQLVGMGSALFESGANNTNIIHSVFSRFLRGRRVKPWRIGEDAAAAQLNSSTNYFSRISDEPGAVVVEFAKGVDPFDVFKKFQGSGLVHTVDNVVKYYSLTTDKKQLYAAYPGNFRCGDVVEIRSSVVAHLNKQNMVGIHLQLLSLVLLDNTLSKSAESLRNKIKPSTQVTLRRKAIDFLQEDVVGEARKKMKLMTVNDEDTEAT
ncbi:hypothetical protein B0H19DRAFT_1060124 [Mycena capillaripes]|nr:hypothetical protein B0H19DRAFT_1060124 [Mycena capillaripes]